MPVRTINIDQKAFKERFREITDKVGGPKRFAEITGISYPSTRKYMDGTDPSRTALTKIIENLDVDSLWLLTGRHEAKVQEGVRILTHDEAIPKTGGPAVEIPVFSYDEYRKCLLEKFDFQDRDGAIRRLWEKHEKLPSRSFDKGFIESFFPSGYGSIMCHRMDDHTMFADIPEGAIMLLDLGKNKVSPGRTYLFRFDDEPIVRKAVQNENSSGWNLIGGSEEFTVKISKDDLAESGSAIAKVTHVFKSI